MRTFALYDMQQCMFVIADVVLCCSIHDMISLYCKVLPRCGNAMVGLGAYLVRSGVLSGLVSITELFRRHTGIFLEEFTEVGGIAKV